MNEKDKFVSYFREIQPKFSHFYATILTHANLTLPQYALLSELYRAGTISMTEISKKLRVSKPAVTSLVDRLEENNFLRRISHPKDRRIFLLQIQPKGKKLIRQVQAKILHLLLQALDQFTAEETKVISRFYAFVSQSIDAVLLRSKGV